MKKRVNRNILAGIVITMFVVGLIPLFLIAPYNHSCADDFSYGWESHNAWESTGSLLGTIKAALSTTGTFYKSWQGTFVSIFFMALQPGVFGEENYALVPYLMLTVLSLGFGFLTYLLIVKICQAEKKLWVITLVTLLFLAVQMLPSPVEGLYWFNGAVHYIFMFSIFMFYLGFLYLGFYSKNRRQLILLVVLASFFGFLLGGGNYVTEFLAFQVTLLLIGGAVLKRKQGRILGLLIPFVVNFSSFLVSAAAPGNAVRQSCFAKPSLLDAIVMTIIYAIQYMDDWMRWPVILGSLFLAPILLEIVRNLKYTFRRPALVLVGLFVLYTSMFFPTSYTMGSQGAGRGLNIIFLVFILFWYLAEAYMLGWLWNLLGDSRKQEKEKLAADFEKMLYLVPVLALIGIFFALKGDGNAFTSASAWNSWRTQEAQMYDAQMDERIELYQDKNTVNAEVKPLTCRPYLLYFDDLTTDAADWRNEAATRYFKKQTIVIKETNN